MSSVVATVRQRLAAPFSPEQVEFKPTNVAAGKALALAYVEARTVMDRLDDVLGVDGWRDEYVVVSPESLLCRLTCRIDGVEVTKVDVGEGDSPKAAVSDALKRAAVKFGVGRYLYRLPAERFPFDATTRTFKVTPTLPAWAIPAK